jgi:hypothetical protein
MKAVIPPVICLIMIGMFAAGCVGNQNLSTSTPAPVPTNPLPPPTQTASFTTGDHYLQKSYSFQSENDVRTEQFRVDNPSWAIEFTVLPLNENLQYCWFEMKVTNMDTNHEDTYGYGRDKGFELKQVYPMYITGPYTIVMKGNRVKVDIDVAQRIS